MLKQLTEGQQRCVGKLHVPLIKEMLLKLHMGGQEWVRNLGDSSSTNAEPGHSLAPGVQDEPGVFPRTNADYPEITVSELMLSAPMKLQETISSLKSQHQKNPEETKLIYESAMKEVQEGVRALEGPYEIHELDPEII